ncbi:MAG: KH domain-containing protein [Verrucomicrobiales bacterium]
METVTNQLKDFLQYITLQFIKEPKLAQLRISHPGEKQVNFRLILSQPDVATLIGRNGFTASTIRSMMKAAADREGVKAQLKIHSHEEEHEYMAEMERREMED